MPPDSDGPGGGEDWLRHARSDLALASAVGPVGDILAETLCFHAQQAAEKALKAVLVHVGIEFPRTHSAIPRRDRTRVPSKARRIHPARVGGRPMGGKLSARLSFDDIGRSRSMLQGRYKGRAVLRARESRRRSLPRGS